MVQVRAMSKTALLTHFGDRWIRLGPTKWMAMPEDGGLQLLPGHIHAAVSVPTSSPGTPCTILLPTVTPALPSRISVTIGALFARPLLQAYFLIFG